MNKGRRNELTQLKWRRRLKNLNISLDKKLNFTCYKTTGKPCSCYMCSPEKYNRNKNKLMVIEYEPEIIKGYTYAF